MKTCSSESQSPRMCGLLSPVCPRENPVYLRNLWGRWLILMGFLKQIQGVEPRKCDRRWHGNPWKSWRQAFQWEHRSISGGFSSFQLSMWTMVVEFSWDQSSAMGLLDEHGWTIWVRWFGWFDGNLTSWWFIMMFDLRKKATQCPQRGIRESVQIIQTRSSERCSKPLLVDDYRGLYYPIYWGL